MCEKGSCDCNDNCQCQNPEPEKKKRNEGLDIEIKEATQSDWIAFMMTPHEFKG